MTSPLPICLACAVGQCSASCGSGLQTRRVFCASVDEAGLLVPAEDDLCDPEKKYESEQGCEAENGTSCAARWMAGPWGAVGRRFGSGAT